VVSPDGRRYASTDNGTENDDPKVVIIDGVAGKEFSKVSAVIFSPDSKRVAYFGITKDGQTMLVVQGHGKTETAVKGEVSMLTFSPDSKNLAYVVTSEEGARVVMDGNKLPSRQPLTKIEHLAFTPGTNIPIYVYYQNDKDLPCGVKYLFDMPSNGTPVVTSADGRRLINVHSKEGVFTLQDVKVGKNPDGSFSINAGPAGERECDSVHSVIISPDDNRLAYAVTDGGKSLAVLDGEDGKAYDDIAKGSLAFSPDSKHFAYLAKSGEDWFIVIDGAEGKKYNQSAPRSAVFFSPDSQHTAFALKNVIVVDKTEYKTKYPLGTYTLIFSPDSKRTAYMEVSPYIGELGVFNYSINIDGDESPEYTGLGWAGKTSEIYQPVFSPDSKHVAYCTLKRDEEGKANKLFVVDTTEVETGMEPWCAPVFDSPTKFHYVGTKDDKVFLVEVEITE
jgi:Tol biopolymer transport system component